MLGEGFAMAEGFQLHVPTRFAEVGTVKAGLIDGTHVDPLFETEGRASKRMEQNAVPVDFNQLAVYDVQSIRNAGL